MPTITVEIAFASDPLNTTPTWTDVTSYVRSGSIKFGRSNEFDEYQAGRATIVLNNRGRVFDPFYTSGPYYGQLTARKQVRIKTTWNSTTRTQFQGFASGFGVAPDVHGDSTWTLEVYDALAYLARIDMPSYLWWQATQIIGYPSGLLSWWPLGETGQSIQDRTGTYTFTFTSTQPRTGAGSKYVDGSSQVFDGTYGAIGPAVVLTGSHFEWSVSFMLKTNTAGPVGGLNPILAGAVATDPATIGIDENGRLAFRQGTNTAHSGFAITDDNWHFVTVNGSASGANIYVDGYLLSAGNTVGTGATEGWQLVGMSNLAVDSQYFTGELQHLACWDGSTSLLSLASAAMNGAPLAGTTTSDWVQDVMDGAGWPAGWQSIETTNAVPGGMIWHGKNALEVLQELARTERGRVIADRQNIVTFQGGAHDYTASEAITSQATYSDSKVAGTIPYSAIGRIVYSDEFLVNRAIVSIADGSTFTADDTASQTTYGIRSQQIDTLLQSGVDALSYAEMIVSRYAIPVLRIDDWTVLPQSAGTTAFPKILPADIAERVTVEILPSSVGSRISQQMLIESVSHSFDSEQWTTTFSGSPAVQGWLLEDATYGLLESTTILA